MEILKMPCSVSCLLQSGDHAWNALFTYKVIPRYPVYGDALISDVQLLNVIW